MPPLNMDNEGFQPGDNTEIVSRHEIIEPGGNNGFTIAKKFNSGVDLNRAVSITREDEQVTFSWDKLTVKTKASAGRSLFKKADPRPSKTLVNNISGYVRPGELVAIMGASGAGKSTMLNALTFRCSDTLDVSGTRFINGNPISPNGLTAVSAYIMQDDLFIGTLTPREHLSFMSQVRMDQSLTRKERKQRVDNVIKELGLTKCQNTVIGISGIVKGISGGESKRLALASELLTNPPLLFCDEPTSGLDSFMAQNVVATLRALTRQGKAIVCTIHQPSSEVFRMFDRVLLMAEGQLAYLGKVDQCQQFFSDCGYPCPRKFNPSDHYINTLAIVPGNEENCRERVKAITAKFHESDQGRHVLEVVEYEKSHIKENKALEKEKRKVSPYRASWWSQFWALLWRAWISSLKDPQIMWVNFGQTVAIGLLIGVCFLDQDYDQTGIINLTGAGFILLTAVAYVYQFTVINVFCLEMPVFLREHHNGTYRVETYYITKQLAELPIYLILPVIISSIFYWMVGMNDELDRFLIFTLIIVLLTQLITSWGYCLSALTGDVQLALALAPPIMIPFMLFGGFFVNADTVPDWLAWIEYISYYYYANEAIIINQWEGVGTDQIKCDQPVPAACQFNTGEDVINFYAYDKDNLWLDIGLLAGMMVLFRVTGLISLFWKARRRHH